MSLTSPPPPASPLPSSSSSYTPYQPQPQPPTTNLTTTFPFHLHPHTSFPPFYTLQPNTTTRTAQLTAWSTLLTSYCSHTHTFRLSPRAPIFHNTAINRRLAPEDAAILFTFMRERGTAVPVGASGKQGGRAWLPYSSTAEEASAEGGEMYILWHSLDEWASQLLEWVEGTGQRGSVLTVFEMTEGDASVGRGWREMPGELFRRVVDVVVRRGRGAVLGEGEGVGVKFF